MVAIERGWSATKAHLRDNDDLTYAQLKINMDHALYRIPVQEFRRYIVKSLRFMSVYDFVNTGPLAELIVRRFKSHRGVCKSDLAVYCSELERKLETIQGGTSGDMVAERARIARYLPELRAVITAEGGGVDREIAAAVKRAAEAGDAARAERKRRAEESAEKELERDRERKAKKRRLTKEQAEAEREEDDDDMELDQREE